MSAYADRLGRNLRHGLDGEGKPDLRTILADAINRTARELNLSPGHSPSSTVTIARQDGTDAEFLILGDNLIALPGETITDNRLHQLGLDESRQYRHRLAAGHGYGPDHQAILRQLQDRQAKRRNRDGGYWIAEADPDAASHAIVIRRNIQSTPWAVLATDGAYKTMAHLGLDDWKALSDASPGDLMAVLRQCQDWEESHDPEGRELPRAKRHDDKSLAVTAFNPVQPDQPELADQKAGRSSAWLHLILYGSDSVDP